MCGSVSHGAPYFADGWSAYVGCSLTYVRGFALAVLSLCRTGPDGHGLIPGPLPVGIDADFVDQGGGLREGVARRILAAQESEALTQLEPRDAPRALLRAWTEKEAVLKASGWGLSVGPRRVSTALGTSEGTSTASLDVAGRTQQFHIRHVGPDAFPEPWAVSVAMNDTARAHAATFRLHRDEG